MDSLNVGHVPAPEFGSLWDFRSGENLLVMDGPRGKVSLMLKRLGEANRRAEFMMTVVFPEGNSKEFNDWLNINAPCVALKLANDEPMLTFTLREIRDGAAFVQVTAHPSLEVRSRPDLSADMRRRGYR